MGCFKPVDLGYFAMQQLIANTEEFTDNGWLSQQS